MKYKQKNDFEGLHIVTFAFKKLPKRIEEQFELLFYKIEDYKNDFVNFINSRIKDIEEENEEIKQIQEKIDKLHNTEGKVSKEEEKSDELKALYKEKGLKLKSYFYEKNGKLNGYQLIKDFNNVASPEYNLYLHDDAKSFAKQNIIASLEKWVKGEGKAIHTHKYGNTSAIQSRRNIDDEGNTRSTMIQFIFEGENLFVKMWDINKNEIQRIKSEMLLGKKIVKHNYNKIKVNINPKDKYQQQIFKSPRYGNAKLNRIWKNGKWFYRIQIALKDYSLKVKNMTNKPYKIGIDSGTETIAVVRNDGLMYIEEVSPNTPRFAKEKIEVQQRIDHKVRLSNPHRFKENGVPYSKKEAKKLNLEKYRWTKNTLKLKKDIKTMCSKNARKRKKNNEKTAKTIFELGNEFYIEPNNFRAWKMKRCRMNKIAKEKYDNGIRKNDYTKQAQDRATAQIPARIKSLCEQKQLGYNVIDGLNLSTYNHFTGENDLFLTLKDRLITLDKNCEDEENKIIPFEETISTIEYNGKKYILQRDLYAASKMLFCYTKKEKIEYVNKNGEKEEKIIDKWYFDREGYIKFFDEIFYKKQEKYIEELIQLRKEGKKINGTILG